LPELDYARETLAVIESLLRLGLRTPWFRRMVLSRLYYAAHHLARRLLRNAGLRPERWHQDVHRRVLWELERRFVNPGVMSANALHALWRLRRLRTRADYEITIVITDRDVDEAVAHFTVFLNEGSHILGVT